MMPELIAGLLFTQSEIISIVIVCVVLAALIALNIVLIYKFRKLGERKLCTRQLQQKRDELLQKLNDMRNGIGLPEEIAAENAEELPVEEEPEDEAELDEEDDDDEDDSETFVAAATPVEGEEESPADDSVTAEILAVRDMSATTRERLGFTGAEYNRKQYYVRYKLGFDAKLREADPVIQERYKAFITETGLYKGIKIKDSFKQQRIYKGKKTLGLILFKGKTLCIAFALNPQDYAETKYRGIDKSDKKRFEKTPMLFKLTSDRKLEYAKYLLVQIADANTIVMNEQPVEHEFDFSVKTRDELFVGKKLQIRILGEAPDLDSDEVYELPEAVSETVEENVPEESVTEEPVIEEPVIEEPVIEESSTELIDEEQDSEPEETEEIPDIEADDEEEITEEIVTAVDGGQDVVIRRIRYNRSFTARIIQSSDEVKARYSALKNEMLSYNKVKSAISWRRESFRLGRKTFACFVVRGKTLCLCLATDPKQFDGTKYKVIDLTVRSPKSKQPCMYRITSDRRVKFAKQLIAMLMQEYGVTVPEMFESEDYVLPYESTEALIQRDLIRIIGDGTAVPELAATVAEEPVEEEQLIQVEEPQVEEPEPERQEEEEFEELPERDFEILEEVDVAAVEEVMSDETAEQLVEDRVITKQKSTGRKKGIINIDSLSRNFEVGSHVTVATLREKGIIANDINYIKVLAKGTLNKPLIVEADDFSLQAVKMLVLTGGRAIRRKFRE